MTDIDLLTGTIAARLRTMPEIEQLYPARPSPLPGPLETAAGVLTALTDDRTVDAQVQDGITRITVDLAVTSTTPAPQTARAAAAAVTTLLDAASITRRRITVRVASITP